MAERAAERCTAPRSPGATICEEGATFAVLSRNAESIHVCLFDERDRETGRFRLPQREGDLHFGFLPRIGALQRYGLRADGPWAPEAGHRFDPAKLLVDPYATRLDRAFAYDPVLAAPRDGARDTSSLVPKAIIEAAGPDATSRVPGAPRLIYELCVKAYSHLDDGAPLALRGTLGALASPHVIERFVKLGVSHVELMPVAAWIDERHLPPLGLANAWGYNPVAFMALDPRLAPGGFADLRRLVEAMGAAGVGVILDVVFNHSGESDEFGPTLSLRGLDNALYYRHAPDGRLINDAGCGNILAYDEPVVIRLVLDALRRFAKVGISGFRFDLATTLGRRTDGFSADAPLLAAIAGDPALRDLTLIAEPWDVGPGGYQLGRFRQPWLEWNDRYRDDVRRFWRGDRHAAGPFATRISGSSDLFQSSGRAPSTSVNFLAAHDGYSLRDLVSYSIKRNLRNGEDNRDGNFFEISWNCGQEGEVSEPARLARRACDVRAMLATLFLSRGTPMLTAGDEFGRTQHGNNNAYAQDNETTWLDWAARDASLAEFVASLLHLRAALPALREDRFLTGAPVSIMGHADAAWTRADGCAFEDGDWADADFIGLTLVPACEAGDRVHLMFNRGFVDVGAKLPATAGAWRLMLDSARPGPDHQSLFDGDAVATARSVLAFVETDVAQGRMFGRSSPAPCA